MLGINQAPWYKEEYQLIAEDNASTEPVQKKGPKITKLALKLDVEIRCLVIIIFLSFISRSLLASAFSLNKLILAMSVSTRGLSFVSMFRSTDW